MLRKLCVGETERDTERVCVCMCVLPACVRASGCVRAWERMKAPM